MKIENPFYLIPGNRYKIVHPCYDDYNEGLLPNIEIVEFIRMFNGGFLFRLIYNDLNYSIQLPLLMQCEIYDFVD